MPLSDYRFAFCFSLTWLYYMSTQLTFCFSLTWLYYMSTQLTFCFSLTWLYYISTQLTFATGFSRVDVSQTFAGESVMLICTRSRVLARVASAFVYFCKSYGHMKSDKQAQVRTVSFQEPRSRIVLLLKSFKSSSDEFT